MYDIVMFSNGMNSGSGLTTAQSDLVKSIPDIQKELERLAAEEVTDDKIKSEYDYAKMFTDEFI